LSAASRRGLPDEFVGVINNQQIRVGTSTVTHTPAPFSFVIQTDSSNVTSTVIVDGNQLAPQSSGADQTTASGTILVGLDDPQNPTTITIAGANVDLNVGGDFQPSDGNVNGTQAADFGFSGEGRFIAIRDIVSDVTSLTLPLSGGQFAASDLDIDLTNGRFVQGIPQFSVLSTTDLTGNTLMPDSGLGIGQLSRENDTYTLTIPLNHTMDLSGTIVTIGGSVQATFTIPSGEGEGTFRQNQSNPLDVNADNHVSAVDALLPIDLMNGETGEGETPGAAATTKAYVDVSGDGLLSPIDALLVINALNQTDALAEGEAVVSLVGSSDDELTADLRGPVWFGQATETTEAKADPYQRPSSVAIADTLFAESEEAFWGEPVVADDLVDSVSSASTGSETDNLDDVLADLDSDLF